MKKAEAEKAIRSLTSKWPGRPPADRKSEANFLDFYEWLEMNHSEYLDFRGVLSVEDTVEMWFAQEFKQTWQY